MSAPVAALEVTVKAPLLVAVKAPRVRTASAEPALRLKDRARVKKPRPKPLLKLFIVFFIIKKLLIIRRRTPCFNFARTL